MNNERRQLLVDAAEDLQRRFECFDHVQFHLEDGGSLIVTVDQCGGEIVSALSLEAVEALAEIMRAIQRRLRS